MSTFGICVDDRAIRCQGARCVEILLRAAEDGDVVDKAPWGTDGVQKSGAN